MNLWWALPGIALVVVAVIDALWTTLWVDGAAGPLTSRASSAVWRAGRRLAGPRHRPLSLLGPLILSGTLLGWVVLLGAGWVLLFTADPHALTSTRDGSYADWTGRVWFVAYAMFTMGNGDYSPREGGWELLAAAVNASGMMLITLAVTYLLSVVSAVTAKRAFASSVLGLGDSPERFVLAGWNGRDLHPLDRQLTGLAAQLNQLTEKYLSYPVLQYYHAARPAKSPALAIGVLDDALTLLHAGVGPHARPDPAAVAAARSAVAAFLETLRTAFIPKADEPLPPPDLSRLRDAGVPVTGEAEFADELERLRERRSRILGLIRNDGYSAGSGG